jgi:hypothetical protein
MHRIATRCAFAALFILAGLLGPNIAFGVGFLPGGGVDQNNPNLPPDGVYLTPDQVHAMYNGAGLQVVLSNVHHRPFVGTALVTPINGGVDTQDTFSSTVTGDVSINGGPSVPISGTAPVTVVVSGNGPAGSPTGTFNTEMLQLDLNLGGGIMVRESPTLPSLGQTQITPIGGGNFHIDSFFDVFTELSVDGGNTWMPDANGPARVNLVSTPEPASVTLLGLGLAGLFGGVGRRRA